jgi:hypothetical protein
MRSFLNVKACGTYSYHCILKVATTGDTPAAASDEFDPTLFPSFQTLPSKGIVGTGTCYKRQDKKNDDRVTHDDNLHKNTLGITGFLDFVYRPVF